VREIRHERTYDLFSGSFGPEVTRFSGRSEPLHLGSIPPLPDDVSGETYSHGSLCLSAGRVSDVVLRRRARQAARHGRRAVASALAVLEGLTSAHGQLALLRGSRPLAELLVSH